jgi:hypothetical protein
MAYAEQAAGGYSISRSLRFNSSDSAYLSRTPASAGNRKTWTWAAWVKRNKLGVFCRLFSAGTGATDATFNTFAFTSGDLLSFEGTATTWRRTSAVFRDPGAWMHVVLAVDTTSGTAANRVKLYVNGAEVSAFTISSDPSSSYDYTVNNNTEHQIGADKYNNSYSYYSDCQLADIHFIDGQALTPSSFTETDATTGQLIPKTYTGSYGTNGFHLPFNDNATAAALGTDTSGNGNTWTVNNLSVTAGAGNDSLVDSPVNGSQVDTGAGGEVRGNYATLNPLAKGGDIQSPTNGNLQVTSSGSGYGLILGTVGMSSGKWYWEVTTTSANCATGIATNQANLASYGGADAYSWVWASYSGGSNKRNNSSQSSYGSILANGDVVGIAFDADSGTLTFYKNNVSQGAAYTGLAAGTYLPVLGDETASANIDLTANFGQRPFAYTAPSGFKALNTANLPAPLVTKPSTVFDTLLWTGNGSARSITGLGFNPDLVWIKSRSAATDHELTDSVRGTTKSLSSNLTAAEATDTGGLTAFNSDGFSLGTDTKYNNNAATYAGWCWDAGSSTVTNTQGSITSSVRANTSAGFSIVTYTGNLTQGASVGHGLGVAPSMIIVKNRSSSGPSWAVGHTALGGWNKVLYLNLTDAVATQPEPFNGTTPSSTVFQLWDSSSTNSNGANYVAYCFAAVAGYSSFGSYTGGGSEYPFVYCGFRPRFILIKNATTGGTYYDWFMLDTARNPYNFGSLNSDSQYTLFANTSGQEQQWVSLDILSNGFRVIDQSVTINASGSTFVFAAFAEAPFQTARAR